MDRSSILDPRSSPPRVKLLDFGLARAISEDVRLTQTGTILGTPSYMSPEQARGEDIDHRSDLFSLGCVLYRLCTGELPFRGETTIAILTALAVDTPRPVREINATVPPQLGGLISRLLAKNPDDRPGSAAEVIAAIEAIERGSISVAWKAPAAEVSPTDPTRRLGVETYVPGGPVAQAAPTPAPTNPLLEELLRRARHNRRMMWIKVLLFLVVLGALGLFFGPLAYRYATDQGQIVIPGGDADTEILIRKGGAEVGRGRGRSMTWKAGTWEVEVRSRGQWMGEERVTLKRGGTVTIGPPAGP